MSKITIALLLLISTFTPMMAKDGYNVSLMSEPRIGIGTGINSEIPSITVIEYDSSIIIYSDSAEELYVTIYDINNIVLYEGYINCTESGYEIRLPSHENEIKSSVELYTKEQHLYGYF